MFIKGKAFIEFAQKWRFNPNGIRFQCMYSSAVPNSFLVDYLVSSLGFTREEAIATSAKVRKRRSTSPQVISRRTPRYPDLVLNFLKLNGLDHTQIKNLVSKAPELLYYDVNRTIKPKFEWLQELGLSVSGLVKVLARDKTIMERGLDTHLRPRFHCLRAILGTDENVLKVIRKSCWVLTFGTDKTVRANLLLMQNFGMSNEQIKKLVLRRPNYIAQNSNEITHLLLRVERDFGIPRASAMFVYGADVLFSVKKSKLETKMEILKCFGWSDSDIVALFSKMPYCFNQSEDRLEKVLSFFMNELGYKPAYLASHPSILAYSLDKRVVPRLQVLRILDHKKLHRRKFNLYSALALSESKFVNYFVLPHKDQIPDLYESHKKIVSQ